MSPNEVLFEGSEDFESWREHREKRNRRAIYFFAIILLLILLSLALPNSGNAIFQAIGNQTTSTQGETGRDGADGATGADGFDGADGVDGLNGLNGLDGAAGIPGLTGPAGPAGPPGPQGPAGADGVGGSSPSPSPSPSSSGNVTQNGTIRVGTCDDDVQTSMRSRLVSGTFYFRSITISDIASACLGKRLDVYLLNAADAEISSVSGISITGSSLTVSFDGGFSPQDTVASLIKKVALEIRN
jgi:hypothetical protein